VYKLGSKTPVFDASLTERTDLVKNQIFTIVLKSNEVEQAAGLKNHYDDLDMIGKHFLISDATANEKKR
jgi:hypothetical protein